jgi:hypothetical protein
MSIGHGSEGVQLEVLVGADLGDGFNRTPVGKRGLGIIEPLIGQVLEVVGVNVGDTLGNLGAGHSTVKVEHLGSNLLEDIGAGLDAHQLIVELVSCADDLNII